MVRWLAYPGTAAVVVFSHWLRVVKLSGVRKLSTGQLPELKYSSDLGTRQNEREGEDTQEHRPSWHWLGTEEVDLLEQRAMVFTTGAPGAWTAITDKCIRRPIAKGWHYRYC